MNVIKMFIKNKQWWCQLVFPGWAKGRHISEWAQSHGSGNNEGLRLSLAQLLKIKSTFTNYIEIYMS